MPVSQSSLTGVGWPGAPNEFSNNEIGRAIPMTAHIQFNFLTKSVSAYDAVAMVADAGRQRREYQLAKLASGDPNHEVDLGLTELDGEDERSVSHGDPVSPVIESAELSISGFYAEFRFTNSAMFMTIPATSTVTLGWLERETHDV